MSDLSFLIQTQNQVVIDQNYLQKCQQDIKQNQIKRCNQSMHKVLSTKQIKINKNKTLLQSKGKSSMQKSFKNLFSDANTQPNNQSQILESSGKEQMSKISLRLQALEENQKRMEQKIGIQFFTMKQEIQKKNKQQNQQVRELNRVKTDMMDTKKKIGELLGLIAKAK